MKYTVLTPVKHNGKRLEEGATVNLEEGAATDRLVELGAVEATSATKARQQPLVPELPLAPEPHAGQVQQHQSPADAK